MPGTLILAGTPIGDIGDATPRLKTALSTADVVAAEDTRRLRALARRLEIEVPGRVVSYFDGNEIARTPELIGDLVAGQTVVLVTDAGMPSVSDPGYRLVAAAYENGIAVTVIPGPSATVVALALSGLPSDRFCFEGFLPRKPGPRQARLADLAEEDRTMIFFEAPHRLAATLTDMKAAFGGTRRVAVCRELTKTYEETRRGSLSELTAWAQGEVLGEITIVVAGAEPAPTSLDEAVALARTLIGDGEKPSSAVARIARRTGVNRADLYDAVSRHSH